ncbi:hypothetical protein G5C65_36275 [Streptomyces sp. SB3404]|uniref:EXPERA domain-containing protein n=2 Tax=Streptomyces boncukensis TaxID=2711219 RepID=A0A6G4XA00_9ACTN|nr:hypothetical protein [Streptomyces boncukensis]
MVLGIAILVFPGSMDLSVVPGPWSWFFRGLYLAEAVSFGVGLVFLGAGRLVMPRRNVRPALFTAAHLSVAWLLASWWPQDNLYRLAAKDDWPQQTLLVYVFNIPLMIAAVVVVLYLAALREAEHARDPD